MWWNCNVIRIFTMITLNLSCKWFDEILMVSIQYSFICEDILCKDGSCLIVPTSSKERRHVERARNYDQIELELIVMTKNLSKFTSINSTYTTLNKVLLKGLSCNSIGFFLKYLCDWSTSKCIKNKGKNESLIVICYHCLFY